MVRLARISMVPAAFPPSSVASSAWTFGSAWRPSPPRGGAGPAIGAVWAPGARPFKPKIPGIDEHGYNAWEVLQGTEVPGNSILVIDEEYGFQAPSAAEYLLDRGKQVDIVTSERAIGSFLGPTTAPPV